ncbi:GPI transamidase component PIG-T-like [Homarus americanus]|uniref:GPI transamidase component PIG-T-like n=1 Tax=Homarus americanus TaxID=6706 RepID=UPI001C46C762|nr:GPI transamidase component PIG-T-like [Homarus americanus]
MCHFHFLLVIICGPWLMVQGRDDNTFTEELLIRPLSTGHVYSHFEFTTTWATPGISDSINNYRDFEFSHYDLFPRAFGEIVERYHVRELHLSLTQGLWRHRKWGYPIVDAPPGAQLWVWFNPTTNNLDQTWRDLVNALSGLVCASLNFIDSTNTVSPGLSYRPQGLAEEWYSGNSSYMRYAALPRENVCTENLTPWKKLLPCDTRSGLSMLLYPVPLYTAHYHALSLHLRPSCQDVSCTSSHLELTQALSLVQGPTISSSGHQDWSLQQLFSSQLIYTCPLASFSRIYVDVTGNVDMKKFTLNPEPDIIEESGSGVSVRQLAVYDIQAALAGDGFNIEATYKSRHIYGILPPPNLHVSRFITGYGQESGSITVKFTNTGSKALSVVYLEVLPWYLRLFLHTSHSHDQMQSLYVSKLVTARDREQGWLYEAVVEIPASSTIELSLEFTRALLKWLEYPPDANHGFYIPAATISAILPNSRNVSVNNLNGSTLKEKLLVQDRASFVRIHTETLLVSLPTPDFSMPYNVICLACTVVALAFGPIHNITTKKLVLKKIEPKESFFSRIMNRIKSIVKRGHKTGNDSIANNSTQEPVTVEENPLYEDREELEDIAEEEEDEDKLSCKSMNDYENKKNR